MRNFQSSARLRLGWLLLGAAIAALGGGPGAIAGSDPARPGLPAGKDVTVEFTSYQGGRASLEGGVGWINTSGPIHLEELRGKIVLLDFWTYCCINCHHVLPDLAYLEEKYKNELVVIGVHTAKFDAEKSTENIRKKVAEYRIKHPVVNDANQVIWNRFGVDSWPTIVVIDPEGNYLDRAKGEGNRKVLDEFIGRVIAHYKTLGKINETPVEFYPEVEKPHKTGLLYPGKILADAPGKRLFISDTGHNRIVVTDLAGKTLKTIGSGEEGLAEGSFDQAKFNRPQGMCLVGETLYVADTENHAIRAIDLKSERVDTVAGTGEQSHRQVARGDAKETGLNSPWDVLLVPGTETLAIAMAGPHQIWKLDLASKTVGVWAGSGIEGIVDGSTTTAAFAQPSGLATDGHTLYVADSEVSGIRALPLTKTGVHQVHTIIGVHLFGFGDVDGTYPRARLQHCLGLGYGDGKLYVADTYNNKIKVCDPKSRSVHTFVGAHQPGSGDAPPHFDEPGGISIAGETLYVADTNNHAIRAVDLKTKKVTTLKLDVEPPQPTKRKPSFPNAVAISVPEARVAPGNEVTLAVELTLPPGFKLNAEAPMPYLVESPGHTEALGEAAATSGSRITPPSGKFTVHVPLAKPVAAGETLPLRFSLAAFVCRKDSALCTIKSYIWTIPVTFADGAPAELSVSNAPAVAATK